ncbi:ribosomal protein S16 [Jaminaea rosea]|uniref:Ribosomal protein S16 n=1 Tax=Jaminaea rosea TaxID=1569628 RepID=A0A316UV78_9BASI|nr:ribosomal protein S16 [Jaminaea rosea]PWN27823.1 ribosomal protein S16 [Jaminaea rosea]
MPVRLRLARHGTRNAPFYHVVAIPDHKPRDARPIEKLGEYDPIPRVRKFTPPQMSPHANMAVTSSGLPSKEQLEKKEKRLEWNTERIRYWLSVGAQPSKPVAKMLDRAGLIPEGKWFKGMYRPPAEASHFNPQLETADGAASASSSSNAASSAKPPPPAPAEKPSAA